MKISVISPHRGDACFALGLSLVRWAKAGHRIRLVNLFTRSTHAPYSDADTVHANDRLSYVSAMREKEDRVFLRRLAGAEMLDLRLKEAPIRLRCAEREACGLAVNDADPAMAKIAVALEKRLGQDQVDVLFLPLGTGLHTDHSTARDATLAFARDLPCAFYEDMPYSSWEGAETARQGLRRDVERRIGSSLSSTVCRAGTTEGFSKRELSEIHCSQIDEVTVAGIAEAAKFHGGERVWANKRMLAFADGYSVLTGDTSKTAAQKAFS